MTITLPTSVHYHLFFRRSSFVVRSFTAKSRCLCSLSPQWDKKKFVGYSRTLTKTQILSDDLLKDIRRRHVQLDFSHHCNTGTSDKIRNVKVDKVLTVPNILTFSRLLLAPVITYCVLTNAYPYALSIFVYAGITDVADGYIARNWKGQSSVLGSMIDPLADKVLVVCLSLSLAYVNLLPVWLVSLILLRDFSLITGAAYLRFCSLPSPKTVRKYFDVTLPTVQIRPSKLSKFNTFLQLLLITATLSSPVFGFEHHPYLQYLCYLTGLTTVLSGTGYLISRDSFTIIGKQIHK